MFQENYSYEKKYLHYPGIVSTDEENYLILEFLEGEKGCNESLIDTSVFAGAIRVEPRVSASSLCGTGFFLLKEELSC